MEITLDMSSGMHAIARECFPNAEQVIDRFHVQKLACDALQELRIEHRWEAINEETNEMENARLEGKKYTSLFCEQLYDLAMISHKPLSPDEMTKFVSRSNQIMTRYCTLHPAPLQNCP